MQSVVNMDSNSTKPKKKLNQRDIKARAVTLPAGVAPAVLLSHKGGGFFGKLRRCLRLGSKGSYDFNHSAMDAASLNNVSRNENTESHVLDIENEIDRPCDKASPLRVTRRQKQDKEEVVLIRKDKRISGAHHVLSRSEEALTAVCDDVFIVKFAEDKPNVEGLYVSAATENCCRGPQMHNMRDDIFDELDPDYETLDEVRKKVRGHMDQNACSSLPSERMETKEKATKQGVQIKDKTNSDASGRDSGLGSPFTDSPVFNSHSHSPLLSEASEYLGEGIQPSTFNSRFAESKSGVGQFLIKHSGTGQLDSSKSASELEEDDLYANSKVIIRKKSQKQSQSAVSSSDRHSFGGLSGGQTGLSRQSQTPADAPALVEDPATDSLIPPPLPERNYSEEDFSSMTIFQSISCPNVASVSAGEDQVSGSASLTFRSAVNVNKSEKDARPKILGSEASCPDRGNFKVSDASKFVDAQPCFLNNSTILSRPSADSHSFDLDSVNPQNHSSLLPSCNQTSKDNADAKNVTVDENYFPARTKDEGAALAALSQHTETAAAVAEGMLPGDIMIVSASDSMCEIVADDTQSSVEPNKIDHTLQSFQTHKENDACGDLDQAVFSGTLNDVVQKMHIDQTTKHTPITTDFFPIFDKKKNHPKGKQDQDCASDSPEGIADMKGAAAVGHDPKSDSEHQIPSTLPSISSPCLSEVDIAQSSLATSKNVDPCDLEVKEPLPGISVHGSSHELLDWLDHGSQGPPPLPTRTVTKNLEDDRVMRSSKKHSSVGADSSQRNIRCTSKLITLQFMFIE